MAVWLQNKLEHYKLPSNLNGRTDLPKEIRPVFRDKSDLAGGVLADEIQSALESSKYLIVICSPRAAQSPWVAKEVQSFIDMGRTDKIIPFIIGGTAHAQNPEDECFPSALLNLPPEQELLGINIDEMGRDAAAVKVVAQMFGLKFDALWQRYEKERYRKRLMLFFSAFLIAFIGAIVAFAVVRQNRKIERQIVIISRQNDSLDITNQRLLQSQQELKDEIFRYQMQRVKTLLSDNKPIEAFFLLREMDELYHVQMPFLRRDILLQLEKNSLSLISINEKEECPAVAEGLYLERDSDVYSPDSSLVAYLGERLEVIDANTKKIIYENDNPLLCGLYSTWSGVIEISSDNRYVLSLGISRFHNALTLVDLKTGEMQVLSHWWNYDYSSITDYYFSGTFSPDSKELMIYGSRGIKIIRLLDMVVEKTYQDAVIACKYENNNKNIRTTLKSTNSKFQETYHLAIEGTQPTINQFIETSPIWSADMSPDCNFLALATENGARVWDINHHRSFSLSDGYRVCIISYSHDGTRIAMNGITDADVKIVTATGKTIFDLESVVYSCCEAERYSMDLAFSPNDNYIIVLQSSGGAVYSLENGNCIGVMPRGNVDCVGNLCFLCDSVVVCDDNIYSISCDTIGFVSKTDPQNNALYRERSKRYYNHRLWNGEDYPALGYNQDSTYLMATYPDHQILIIKKEDYRDWMRLDINSAMED